jgi:hypothetical protein
MREACAANAACIMTDHLPQRCSQPLNRHAWHRPPPHAPTGALPRLAWCSLGSSPAAAPVPPLPQRLPHVTQGELALGPKLGQGASGEVFVGACALVAAGVLHSRSMHAHGGWRACVCMQLQGRHQSLTPVLHVHVWPPPGRQAPTKGAAWL